MIKLKKNIISFSPYIYIFVLSLIGTYIFFYKGLNSGDDYAFHIANIYDEYKSLLNGYKLSAISGNIGAGIGVGNRLFYSPLPHLTVALMAVILKVFGVTFIGAYKTVLVLNVFLSGVIMYRLAMHISHGKRAVSVITAGIYVIYPYRLFNMFCRLAFAEAFSFLFLPLFFMGLYDIVSMKEIRFLPFLEVIVGGALLYLSHNITAVYAFVFGIIFLICNFKKIIKLFHRKSFLPLCLVSVFLLLGISSVAWISQLELMGTDIYNITDRKRMWTDLPTVLKRLNQQFDYSGFLNTRYMVSRYPKLFTYSSIYTDIILFILISFFTVFIDNVMTKNKYLKKVRHIISFAVYAGFVCLFISRIEIYFAAGIAFLTYLFVLYIKDREEPIKENSVNTVTFWFSLFSIVVILIMMSSETVWEHMPEMFLNIQFPWRLWSLVQVFVSILVCVVCTKANKKTVITFCTVFLGFLMAANQPLAEKRLYHEATVEEDKSSSWHMTVDDAVFESNVSMGHNREYIPKVITDNNYVSQYENSLHKTVRYIVTRKQNTVGNYTVKPVILEGSGNVEVFSAYAPLYEMSIRADEKITVQMPLIYYPGYKITLEDAQTGKISKAEAENIDGLISFTLEKGEYKVKTDYTGTTLRKLSFVWMYISVAGVIALAFFTVPKNYKKLYNFYIKHKKGEKNEHLA